jgi:hypothetical protein
MALTTILILSKILIPSKILILQKEDKNQCKVRNYQKQLKLNYNGKIKNYE